MLLLGASGTIGRATLRALLGRGHEVVCLVRPRAVLEPAQGLTIRRGHASERASLARDGFRGERFDALVSCLASRSGVPADAWAIDHQANVQAFQAAADARAGRVVLLSAICVQKPVLAFQHAKLAAEKALLESGLAHSIVRPTAFFKSLSGQVARVQRGRPYLVFGDGRLTSCKPIGDDDLAAYLADCLTDADKHDRILPIGGRARPSRRASRPSSCSPCSAGRCAFARCRSACSTALPARWPPSRGRCRCCRRSPRRPSWPASAATTPASRCWCGTPPVAATTRRRRHRPACRRSPRTTPAC